MRHWHFGMFGLLTLTLVACSNQSTPGPAASSVQAQALSTMALPVGELRSLRVTTPGVTNRSLRHAGGLAFTEVVGGGSDETLRKDATWKVVRGLADGGCYSLESLNFPGEYLRHASSRVRRDRVQDNDLFRRDATWCTRPGLSGAGVSFSSLNFPDSYLRHANAEVWLARKGGPLPSDNAASFDQDASWAVGDAWSAAAGGCTAATWTRGVNYGLGAVVLYPPNNSYYKVVNVGASGSDGTDPVVSTWYWQPTACATGNPSPQPQPGGFIVPEAQFNQMFPSRIPFYTYAGLTAALQAYPAFATTGSDAARRQEAAAFLANIDHESGGLRYVREINQANWPLYCSSGNCGGRQYYGRGPIQLSWDYNYRTAGEALGIDLLNNPELVATDATVAWKTAIWYWMTQRGSAARTPHDAMISGAGFGETIRAINGGIECNAGGLGNQQMQARVTQYRNFTGILGVEPGNNLTC